MNLHIVYLRIIDVVPLVKLGGIARKKRSRVIRTRSWFEAAGIVERVLGSRYPWAHRWATPLLSRTCGKNGTVNGSTIIR